MSRLWIIFSYLTEDELNYIKTKISRCNLDNKNIATEIIPKLLPYEKDIAMDIQGDFGGMRGMFNNTLYGFLYYYGEYPNESELLIEFTNYYEMTFK